MKYTFRGIVVFEYLPDATHGKVIQHNTTSDIPAFNYCSMIPEDYKLLAKFFDTVYRHTQGEPIELKDINVN